MKPTLPILAALILLSSPMWAGEHQDNGNPKLHGQANAVVHGKKKGWRGCNLPPGQAKKYGCAVPVRAVPPPPPPPPVHTVVVTSPAVRVIAPPPPPVHVVVTAPSVRVVVPPPPPPPSVGVQVHVDATIHP